MRFKFWCALVFLSAVISSNSASAKEKQVVRHQAQKSFSNAEAKFFNQNCSVCHSIGTTGGCLGPVLAGEGRRRTKEFIESRISTDPAKVAEFNRLYGHAELMPHKRIPPGEAKKMAGYIMSLPGSSKDYRVKGHAPAPETAQAATKVPTGMTAIMHGKQLVYERSCLQCHSYRGFGGQFAPIFDGIGTRHKASYISARITAAELLYANTDREYNERGNDMPPLGLSEKDISEITAYLTSLK